MRAVLLFLCLMLVETRISATWISDTISDTVWSEPHLIAKRGVSVYGPVKTPCTAYSLHEDPKTWSEAEQACQSESTTGQLARIITGAINDKLLELLSDTSVSSAYFGASDAVAEGSWKYSDVDVCYDDWSIGLPGNDAGKNCATLDTIDNGGHWGDVDCTQTLPFICQFTEKFDCLFPSPCENGGTCQETFTGYECQCTIGFTGDNCESVDSSSTVVVLPTECVAADCENGGSCVPGQSQCDCIDGYSGDSCEVPPLTGCAASGCANGGTCLGDSQCSCMMGFSGDTCDVVECLPTSDVTNFSFEYLNPDFPTEWASGVSFTSFKMATNTFVVAYVKDGDFVSVGTFDATIPGVDSNNVITETFTDEHVKHVEPFVIDGVQYLAIALRHSSLYYVWNGNALVNPVPITTDLGDPWGASHFHYFSNGYGDFLVGCHNVLKSETTESVIYKWDVASIDFAPYQTIPTRDALMSLSFSEGPTTYIVFAADTVSADPSLGRLWEQGSDANSDPPYKFTLKASELDTSTPTSPSMDAITTMVLDCRRYLVTNEESIPTPQLYLWDANGATFSHVSDFLDSKPVFYAMAPAIFASFQTPDSAYPYYVHMGLSFTTFPPPTFKLFVVKPTFGSLDDSFEIIQFIQDNAITAYAFEHGQEIYLLYSPNPIGAPKLMQWGEALIG